jgi:hypothetical protein
MPVTAPVIYSYIPTAPAGNAEISIPLPCNALLLGVRSIRATGASGTNQQPRVYRVSGAAAGAWGEVWRAAAATAPGTLVNTYNINAPVYCAGALYAKLDADAADTFNVEFVFQLGG